MTSQSKAIATIVKTSQGATVKVTSEKSSLTMSEMLDLVADAGKQVLAYKGADDTKAKALETINAKGLALHKGGTRLADGRSKDKQTLTLKQAFLDSMGDLKPAYKQNCYELFAKLVNSGKTIKDLNKSKNKAKNGEGDTEPKFEGLLVKLECHSQLSEFSDKFQAELRDKLAELGYEIA
jgi:hypothetical protein